MMHSTLLGKNPFLHFISSLAVLSLLRFFDKIITLSIKSQIFRSVDFLVKRTELSNFPDNHLQPAYLSLINFAEKVNNPNQIELFKRNHISMKSRKRTHHYLAISHFIRSKQSRIKECAAIR